MDANSREQVRRNRESQGGWDQYGSHREMVTQLLLDASREEHDTLTVLGAGNCNDLDLRRLADRYARLSLVDLDRQAIEAGLVRQQVSVADSGIQIFESDLTGMFPHFDALVLHQDPGNRDNRIRDLVGRAESAQPVGLPAPADVVISTGLISQLVGAVVTAVGESSLASLDAPGLRLLQAVRGRHLRLLSELTRPGGVAILITEVVSSDTVPALPDTRPSELPALLQRCLEAGNFFTGLHPGILYSALNSAENPEFEQVRASPPWLWQFTARIYAVVAIVAQRK